MGQPNQTDSFVGSIICGGALALNAVTEIVAQDASSIIKAGEVLGRVNLSTGLVGTITPGTAGNTGTGAVTMDTTRPLQPGAREGTYTVYFTGATSGYVTGPDGTQIGAAFSSLPNPWMQEVKFVVTGTPAAGDKITIPVPAIVTSTQGNSGSGAITMNGSTPVLAGAKPGMYQVVFTGAAAGYLLDPDGKLVGVPFTSLPNPWANELKFILSGTPQAADVIRIMVAAGTGKLKRMVSTNIDGSQYPEFIALQPIDATAGDVSIPPGWGQILLQQGMVASPYVILQNESLLSFISTAPGMRIIDAMRDAGLIVVAATRSNEYA